MFSVQIETLDPAVMRAFANMFNELAAKGTEIRKTIDSLDLPDAGTDVMKQTIQPTTTAAAVFGSASTALAETGAGVVEVLKDAAAVFGGAPGAQPDANVAQSDAAAVFGGTTDPNLNNGAHSIAGAVASTTAQGVTQDTSTNQTAAQPPAPPAAPVVQTAAGQTPPASPVLLDSNGLPWDSRIHAGTRTQTQKGEWKKKKGVDDATVAKVEAELRAALAIPAKPFTPLNADAGTVAPPPPTTTAQQPAASAAPTTFAELCRYVTGRNLPADKILAVCNKHGLAGLGLVAVRPDLIPAMYADFTQV